MNIQIVDYIIETDSRQFKVKDTNTEVKVKDSDEVTYKTIGYFTKFKDAIKFIANRVTIDNDDIKEVINKLNIIEKEINNLHDIVNIIKDNSDSYEDNFDKEKYE